MKKLHPLLSVLFLISTLSGQGWTRTFGGSSIDSGQSVQQTSDGGYIILGYTGSYGNVGYNFWLIKTDSEGIEEWNQIFDIGDIDYGLFVQETHDEGYILLGTTFSFLTDHSDVWLIKTDSQGEEEWNQTFGGSDDDFGNSVQQTTDGGYIIIGYTESYGNGDLDVWLIKTDSQGNEEWDQTFGGSEIEYGSSIQQTTDDGYIITGSTKSYGNGDLDVWLIKTDSQGNEEWDQTFGGSQSDYGYSVKQIRDEGYVITGYTRSYEDDGEDDIHLIKTDPQGNELWSQTFGGSEIDYGFSVEQTTDDGYVITGSTGSYGNGLSDIWLIKTDSQGNEEWNQTFGGSENDTGTSVIQTTDGGYIIIGNTMSFGNGVVDVWLIKTNSDGTLESFESSNNPYTFSLNQPYPNPFNPSTTLDFSIPFSDNVNIRVLDIVGREVDILMNEYLTNGNHRIEWNGQGHPSGIYFISFESRGFVETQKVVLMK